MIGSVRAMSAPPRRPATWILMPLAPTLHGAADALLHGTAEARCGAPAGQRCSRPPAGRWVGVFDLNDVDVDRLADHLLELVRSLSISLPPLPMTMPGLAQWMLTCSLSRWLGVQCARSRSWGRQRRYSCFFRTCGSCNPRPGCRRIPFLKQTSGCPNL